MEVTVKSLMILLDDEEVKLSVPNNAVVEHRHASELEPMTVTTPTAEPAPLAVNTQLDPEDKQNQNSPPNMNVDNQTQVPEPVAVTTPTAKPEKQKLANNKIHNPRGSRTLVRKITSFPLNSPKSLLRVPFPINTNTLLPLPVSHYLSSSALFPARHLGGQSSPQAAHTQYPAAQYAPSANANKR